MAAEILSCRHTFILGFFCTAFEHDRIFCSYDRKILGCLYNLFEHGFVNTANRAYPVIRQVRKSCSGSYAMFGITFHGIISVSAGIAKIFVHFKISLSFVFILVAIRS